MKERSNNKQLLINLAATVVGFVVNLGIQFFLTPFIVSSLGPAAYGFVGLSNNIITYTQLIAIALNSMASRFITIKYTQGDIESANKYFSSVFYSNIALGAFILLILTGCIVYLQYLLNIPAELILEVKLLLAFLSVNCIISLLTNIYSIATFVKNRLDLSSICNIISNIFRAVGLYICFTLFTPHIWYIGLIGTIVTIYLALTNYGFTKKLTPNLYISRINYKWEKVKELVSSGIWNTISQLGTIIGQGLDLIIANLFIGAVAMGVFSISRQIPFIIISLVATISSVFTPSLTQLYAKGKIEELQKDLNKSIRLSSIFVLIPIVFLWIYGFDFYKLWLPNQNSYQLQVLTILCSLELILSLPLEPLWNIFIVTNKLKISTSFMLCNHLITFIIVIVGVHFADNSFTQLIILASTRTILGIIRSLTFLPLYGAYCLKLNRKTFYSPILRTFITFVISMALCICIKKFFTIETWWHLIIAGVVTSVICGLFSIFITLLKSDRQIIWSKIMHRK